MTQKEVLSPQIFMDATLAGLLLEHRQFSFSFPKFVMTTHIFITKKALKEQLTKSKKNLRNSGQGKSLCQDIQQLSIGFSLECI